jgi:hypothetical protein
MLMPVELFRSPGIVDLFLLLMLLVWLGVSAVMAVCAGRDDVADEPRQARKSQSGTSSTFPPLPAAGRAR